MNDAMQRHDEKVQLIARAVKERVQAGRPVHITKRGVHHVVPIPGDRRFDGDAVDISDLNEVLDIDVERRLCVAEPGVRFADLVRATLQKGLVPKVVPELEGITLGGAVAGCSVESMSYKFGGFHDGCHAYEVVTGLGDVVVLSPDQDALAFHMMHGSFGTLAILTRLTFDLVPALPWVHLTYRTLPDPASFHAEMLERCRAADYDFIDGIAHGPDRWTLCLGRFTDQAPHVSDYRRAGIFYKSTAVLQEDWLTTQDYFFRYDAECHWLTRTFPPLEWKPVRMALGSWVLGSDNLLAWARRLDRVFGLKKRPDVVVDVFVPSRNFQPFMRWYVDQFRFWPLWIVPYRAAEPYPWVAEGHARRLKDDLYVDCAVYGKPNGDPHVDWSKAIEDKVISLAGTKTLISRNHFTREGFWEVWNQPNWQAVKDRLDPKGILPDLYEWAHRMK